MRHTHGYKFATHHEHHEVLEHLPGLLQENVLK